MLQRRAGFDLIQIGLAALAIAVLAGVVMMGVGGYVQSARRSEAAAVCAQIGSAVSRYRYETEVYPPNLDALVPDWLPRNPNDPWNNPYQYASDANRFAVWSTGANGNNDSGAAGVPAAFLGDDTGVISQ